MSAPAVVDVEARFDELGGCHDPAVREPAQEPLVLTRAEAAEAARNGLGEHDV